MKNKSKNKNKNKISYDDESSQKEDITDAVNLNDIKKSIKYLYITKNKKKFRCLLSKFYENSNTGYYNCYDSKCSGRGKIQFEFDKLKNLDLYNTQFEDTEEFILTKKHNITYENHSYKRKELIKLDIINNDVTKDKIRNFSYLKSF